MIFSSDSDYANTPSADERIEEYVKECREKRRKKAEAIENRREQMFTKFFQDEIHEEASIFNYPGFHFYEYTHRKIKFSFTPSLVEEVSERYQFYCTLWFKLKFWRVKKDTFPRDLKPQIWEWFYLKKSNNGKTFTGINDAEINNIIRKIHGLLVRWTKAEKRFRLNRYKRYRKGEDITLDSMEEEMFLSEREINEIHEKRNAILQRMIPPNRKK